MSKASILTTLNVHDNKELRVVFNQRVVPLIDVIKTRPDHQPASNELAELTMQLFQHFTRYKKLPADIDKEDVIQESLIKVINATEQGKINTDPSGNEAVADPYYYFSRILDNALVDKIRRRGPVVLSALESEEGDSIASNIATPVKYSLTQEMKEELGDSFDQLLTNNGFTPKERTMVETAINKVLQNEEKAGLKDMLREYYLGQLLKPYFMRQWSKELEKEGLADTAVRARMFRFRQAVHDQLQRREPEAYEGGLRDHLQHIEEFRRTFHDDVEMPEPAAQEREYISPTEMVARMRHGTSPEMRARIMETLTDLLTSRRNERIILDDKLELPASAICVARSPLKGGPPTIYVDSKAQGFFEEEMNHHPKREGWLPLSRFDLLIDRPGSASSRKQLFEHFYEQWKENPKIEVAGKKRPLREYVGFFTPTRGHTSEMLKQGMDLPEHLKGLEMYFSPELKDYAKENLPHRLGAEQENWLRVSSTQPGKGILREINMTARGRDKKMGVAAYLAVTHIIEELASQGSVMIGEPPVATPVNKLMGKFTVDGKSSPLETGGIWFVAPDLIGEGKPINREAVKALRDEILAHPESYPRFLEITGKFADSQGRS